MQRQANPVFLRIRRGSDEFTVQIQKVHSMLDFEVHFMLAKDSPD